MPPKSGEDEATAALHQAVRAMFAIVHKAGISYVDTFRAAIKSTDLVETMQHVVNVALAASHLKEMAEEAEKCVRSALATQMAETGATTIKTDAHSAYLSRKPAWVSIDQEEMLPPEYMRQPPPAPDKKAIKVAIEAGELVPGTTLIRPNDYTLVIKPREKKNGSANPQG